MNSGIVKTDSSLLGSDGLRACHGYRNPSVHGEHSWEQEGRRLSETVIDLIDRQCARTPERIAVSFEGTEFSYGDLQRRANKLSQFLRRRNVGPESLVGFCVERSADMVVGLLGILKAGGAYLPLDPNYPEDRLRFMLQDSGAKLLVTEEKLVDRLPQLDLEIICLDTDWREINQESEEPPVPTAKSENLAYVIYTSGSTGQPKGVMIPHSGLRNLLSSMAIEPGMDGGDVLLAITTLSFDIAGLELYLPLITGAQVVVASRHVAQDANLLRDLLDNCGATVMQATPATWKMLLQSGWNGSGRLRALSGGEALSRDLADALLERAESVWNLYGPTETTIWSTVARVNREPGPITIGRPIANTEIVILDEHGEPVVGNAPGELYIGGDGLARGYWRRPELTAERFVEDPSGKLPARLYRTGDEARYRADGQIECLGRKDHQVKIRGYRIELGEIETALRRHPNVRDSVVVAQPAPDGDLHLVSYFVPGQDSHPPDMRELRAHLQQTLPDYMIPSRFVSLLRLPLTPNGKIDRQALPSAEEYFTPKPGSDFAVPRTEIERQLVGVFERLFDVRPIGRSDNFFDLGGHSLLAVKLFSEIEKTFGTRLPLGAIFQAPTVDQLAALLGEKSANSFSALVEIQAGRDAPAFFCVHPLGSNVLRYRALANLLGPDQPFYGLQPFGLDGKQKPHDRVETMAAEYLKEIRAVQPNGPYHLGGWSFGGIVAFEMAQQLRAANQPVGLVALMDSFFPGKPAHFSKRARRRNPISYTDRLLGEVMICPPGERLNHVINIARGWTVSRARHALRSSKRTQSNTLSDILLDIDRATSLADRAYIPKPYPGKLTLFWCTEWGVRAWEDCRLGWSAVAEEGLEVQTVPGGHRSIFEPPHVEVFAAKLRNCLQREHAKFSF